MERDIRGSAAYLEMEARFERARRPGSGQISDAVEIHASADGRYAAFTGTLAESLRGTPPTRICLADLETGDIRVTTFGPGTDRLPKISPDSRSIAFLSDRRTRDDFQLWIQDIATGAARPGPVMDGWVEYLHWSPSGNRLLLAVAGHGADVSGGQGAVASKQISEDTPSWAPLVDTGNESYRWRRVWVYDVATGGLQRVSDDSSNIWEAVWCADDAIVAVVSPGPSEGLWYTASLQIIDLASGRGRTIYKPRDQLGWPATAPDGRHIAVVDALCSDRWVVAGELRLIDAATGEVRPVDTREVDVAHLEWRSPHHLMFAGHRGFDTVVGVYDVRAGSSKEVWNSRDITTGGRYVTISGLGAPGNFVLIGEGYQRAPEIATVCAGEYRCVRSFDLDRGRYEEIIESVEALTWSAPDGVEIQGWLLRPRGLGPHPLVMNIHGGPVWQWRPVWLGRSGVHFQALLERGYAIFMPNPRGSAGRGQKFVRHVLGDMGGADTSDYLSGLDYLVARGFADPRRLGVIGGSYGGFMTAWLITRDSRFAAAVPIAPVTNHVTEHLVSNIPHFVSLFLNDTYTNPGGKYFERSPIMYAARTRTPTLNICGALDRCTPPEEAVQFHNALLENGVESVLLTYPEEGHGIRKFPATIDFATRVVAWFQTHMPANARPARTATR